MIDIMLEATPLRAPSFHEEINMNAVKGTAAVTGASAGIGKVYADRLAGRGYNLMLIARRGDRLTANAKELMSKYGVAVKTIVADLSAEADLERVKRVIESDESITMLVNNAGAATLAPSIQIKSDARDAMTNLNVTALTRLALAVLPGFKSRNHGTLINIGSVLGFFSLPISSVYSATKGYVLNFTRGLQDEFADTNVAIQLVLPAATATDLWEVPRGLRYSARLSRVNRRRVIAARGKQVSLESLTTANRSPQLQKENRTWQAYRTGPH
jgi:short-subunit dehydrogenase